MITRPVIRDTKRKQPQFPWDTTIMGILFLFTLYNAWIGDWRKVAMFTIGIVANVYWQWRQDQEQ